MHKGGENLQTTYFLLPGATETSEAGNKTPYTDCVKLLSDYFTPKLNSQHETVNFLKIRQKEDQNFESFLTSLRQQAEKCNLTAEQAKWILPIQIIAGIASNETRKKLLEEERTLDATITICRADESLRASLKEYTPKAPTPLEVNRIMKTDKNRQSSSNPRCYNCGREGHRPKTKECPAFNKKCTYCEKPHHFEAVCRKKQTDTKRKRPADKDDEPTQKRIKLISEEHSDESQSSSRNFVFFNGVGSQKRKLPFLIGGASTKLLVDSGSDITVLTRSTFELLRDQINRWDESTNVTPCFGYEDTDDPISFLCTFMTKIQFKDRECPTKVFVANKGNENLVGEAVAAKLRVLYVGDLDELKIRQIEEAKPFPVIPGFMIKLEIDESVPPVRQPFRRIPFALEEKTEQKILELLALDIIEKVTEPPSWLSPSHPVPKGTYSTYLYSTVLYISQSILGETGDVRLTVDLRAANAAIKRNFYVFPSIEDLIFGLKRPCKLSKLDLPNAFHLFLLHPDSREITTFSTKSGSYRFKRLVLGINSAPEEFCIGMDMILEGLLGIVRYMDDILVYGQTAEEHDKNLEALMTRLAAHKIPINEQKSVFGVEELEFLGYIVGKNGIRHTESRIEAIMALEAPKSKGDLQSLLGLVNYLSRFIPNLATLNAPLRELLKSNHSFAWTPEHQKALERIKESICRKETWGISTAGTKQV